MKVAKLAIDNHQFTLILLVLLVANGFVAFLTMPKTEDPLVQPPGSTVVVLYPGGSPQDMERLFVDPIEKALNTLDDIKLITSLASDGLATIHIEFQVGSDAQEKYDRVVQEINTIRGELPQDLLSLETVKWSIVDVSILQLALVSETAPYRQLEQESERLQDRLEKSSGVNKVEIHALPAQEVRISLDLAQLAGRGLSLQQVIAAIQDGNSDVPGGAVEIGSKRLSIKTDGAFASLAEIRRAAVMAGPQGVTALEEIADVEWRTEDVEYLARFNGKRCIYLTVSQKPASNIFAVFDQIRPLVDDFRTTLPHDIDLQIAFDQSRSVADRLNGFFINLLQGVLLVGLLMFAAIGVRAAVIVMLAVPIAIAIAIGLVDLSGFGLQQMTIAGLVIALGLLVDNAIVVIENTVRHRRQGLDSYQAAIQGTTQIGWAVTSSTATTVLAFIPLMLIGDMTGDFIRSMPVIVVYTLIASLLISLTLTPFLAGRLLNDRAIHQITPAQQAIDRFSQGPYARILQRALRHPRRVLLLALLALCISAALFQLVGFSFFPKAEKPMFFIDIALPQGTALARTDAVTREVEAFLLERPELKTLATNVGHGNPRLYYNVISERQKSHVAQIFVELDRFDRKNMRRLIADLREHFAHTPGAKIKIRELEQGPPVEAPIAIRVIGENLARLQELSRRVENAISSELGTVNIENTLSSNKTDLRIRLNREAAAMLGVRLADVHLTVRAALTGLPITTFRDSEGESHDIVVRLPMAGKAELEDLSTVQVMAQTGALVPLTQLASIELSPGPLEISHHDLKRSAVVTADVERGFSVDRLTRRIIARLDAMSWPPDYRFQVGGEMESRQESFGGMLHAILLALLMIFAVLVLQFRSYLQPLVVFSTIPLAAIGSIVALLVTGYDFSFSAFVGVISLAGIVVNNSIILVDYSNQLRRQGLELEPAIVEAAQTRLTPILLTTATTIGGLLPLTLGGGTLWAPMGWAVIGGLLFSTLLTLIVTPVLYQQLSAKR